MSPETYAKVMNGIGGFVFGAGFAMIIGFVWGGWDKMPGEEKGAWGVSSACVAGLEARIKTGA